MKYYLSLIFLLVLVISENASAYDIEKSQFDMLPPHCQAKYAEMYKLGKVHGLSMHPEKYHAELWKRRIGNPWIHMHHYCPAIKDLNRAKISAKYRELLLRRSTGNFKYQISHAKWNPSNYWLLGEAHMKLAEAAEVGNQPDVAMKEYREAIKVYPKNYRFYLGLSRLLASNGSPDEALKVVREGLKQVPKSKSLKRQEKRLVK